MPKLNIDQALHLLSPASLQKHYGLCKKKTCSLCFWGQKGPDCQKTTLFPAGSQKKKHWLACARMQTSADKKWKVRLGCVLCCHFRNSSKISVSPDGVTSTTAEQSSKQTRVTSPSKRLQSISWGSFQIPVMFFKKGGRTVCSNMQKPLSSTSVDAFCHDG